MDFGMVCTVAQTLLTALENKKLRELWSVLGYKSELEALQRTINTVKAVLHDAEAKQEDLSSEARRYVNELKDAVYDADDLLDESASLAERKQLMDGGKFSKKVRVFFSRYNQFGVACNISRGVKHVRNKLDAISSDHSKFGLSLDSRPIKRRREETCSYVYANDIIGREDDVEKVLGMLLDSSVERDVSFLTIVGMGGLGKTALAQLVYNNERVTKEFPLRLWACDGDQDPDKLDLELVLRKILASATGHKHSDSTMDVVQRKLRDKLVKQKFFLVIDDVWNENREEWLKLERFLKGGQRGSWVLVSTRSHETAKIVGNGMIHELKGLSDHSSWCLFKMTAFQDTDEQENSSFEDLVEMGQEIVKRCANVPLAIRAMGSLLFGQDITKWQRVLKTWSADIRGNKAGVMPILKLSYNNFELPIKSCFSYCALFSKDFVIHKRMLIELWIAQGYVVPLENGQRIEDAAEDYFMILLRRCFFQDVNKDKEGKIESCKIHDLMHDVALEVSGNEIYQLNPSNISNVHQSVRHLSVSGNEYIQKLSEKTCIRTYLHIGEERGVDKLLVEKMIMNFKRLRTLDLRYSNLESLPDSIGKLLHLRYLNLSWSNILVLLPKSITKLHNLKTLGIEGCYSLNYLPLGMGKLTRLWRLERFMVGQPSSSEKDFFDGLADLGALDNLNGHLELLFRVPEKSKEDSSSRRGGDEGYLIGKEQLEAIEIVIEQLESCDRIDFEESLLEMLKPHANLKNLGLAGYNGFSMPRWATGVSLMETLPNLVDLVFSDCQGLQYLPWLGTLPRLKRLVIRKLPNLEYVEPEASDSSGGVSYFPRLEELQLLDLPKLKGWWPTLLPSLCFSHLKNLVIERCVEMTSFPLCSSVEHLKVVRCAKLVNEERDQGGISWQHFSDSLRTLELLDLTHLENLPKGMECCTSLHSLSIQKCPKLQSLPTWLPKLTSLSKFQLRKCSKELKERCQNPTGENWHLIQQISRILISD